MADGLLALVAVLLGLGVLRQFGVSGPGWGVLDRLGLVPQWKFFAQTAIAQDASRWDDLHLVVRRGEDAWRELEGGEPPRWSESVWNPHARSRSALGEHLATLATAESVPPTALAYLTVLRHCLDAVPGHTPLQFAVASTRGRGTRPVSLRFLSERHRS